MQALEMLGKLEQVAGNVRMALNIIAGIRAELIRTEKDRNIWNFTAMGRAQTWRQRWKKIEIQLR